jgi:hypothetical protein
MDAQTVSDDLMRNAVELVSVRESGRYTAIGVRG